MNSPSDGRSFECDVFVDSEPGSGAWNMAVDAVCLERCLSTGRAHFRFYQWREPTLSLGHFQRDLGEVPESLRDLPRVRRLSGGGAILHHHELTYSCTVPPGHPLALRPVELYDAVHGELVREFRHRGIECEFRGEETAVAGGPFLCFARGDSRDIVCGTHKIVGSAQRRRKGAVLQHGSILLARSEFASDFPGVNDLASAGPVSAEELCDRLALRLGSRLGVCGGITDLPDLILAAARVRLPEYERETGDSGRESEFR